MFWKQLLLKLAGFGKALIGFLLPIIAKHGEQLLTAALPIALQIVASFDGSPGDGDAKRQLAVARLKNTLIAQGVATEQELGESTLNWIVETALQHLRATQPTS